MSIHIYNSLTRKKEEFIPLFPPKVKMYSCGVTVYDDSHIGHARSLYIFDVIRRYLEYRGFQVRFVRNITDIDDKIINRANELKVSWEELVKKYIANYYADLSALNIEKADVEPRATENIPEMISYILGLMDRDFAYLTETGVYFKVRKFPDYGKLSGQSIAAMLNGARIEPDETKRDVLDFALWKKSKPDEPAWDSPWGKGRPGWHIECSVMSQKFLKTETLDIHAGGRDLIFPHHENEIAQAEVLTGKPFAQYWIHHGLLTINGQKMAKSLGNFVTIKDFIHKYKNANFLKLFFLSAHYAHPMDYTEEKIQEAREALERILILWDKLKNVPEKNSEKIDSVSQIREKFIAAMDDDFNTPQALASIFDLVNLANKNMGDTALLGAVKEVVQELLPLLGISLEQETAGAAISDEEVKEKLKERQQARQNKDFIRADQIRKELEAKGVILEDTKEDTTWRRKL